jgi:hypothetical protein
MLLEDCVLLTLVLLTPDQAPISGFTTHCTGCRCHRFTLLLGLDDLEYWQIIAEFEEDLFTKVTFIFLEDAS